MLPADSQALAIRLPEIGGMTELVDACLQQVARHAQRAPERLQPAGRGEVVATQLAEAVRAPVVRFELRMADGPATVVDPLAILEIHRIQRPALPAPAGRAAAEPAKPREHSRVISAADILAEVEELRGVTMGEIARFDQRHPRVAPRELHRERDARRPGADDRDVDIDLRAMQETCIPV